jgi:hypothetical protein
MWFLLKEVFMTEVFMNEVVLAFLGVLGIMASVLVPVFILMTFVNRKMIQHYTILGEKFGLGLQVTKKFWGLQQLPILSGRHQNHNVILSYYTVGHGKHRQIYTYISIMLTDPGFEFSMAKEGFWNKLFGGQDIKLGDEEFDKAYLIKSKTEDRMRRFLDAGVRKVLLEADASKLLSGNITLSKGDLRYTELGNLLHQKGRNRFEAMMQIMPYLAGKMVG